MTTQHKALRVGDQAPNFQANSTRGPIDLYDYIGNNWAIILATPARSPVSTTEIAYFQFVLNEFDRREVKIVAIAPGTNQEHETWIKEIAQLARTDSVTIPIIEDPDSSISMIYDMVDDPSLVDTIRDTYIIDHTKKIRLIFSYPENVGASVQEVVRVIDALQTPDNVSTPAGWTPDQPVLVNPSVPEAAIEKGFSGVTKPGGNVTLGNVVIES